jgi:hypothetical protein
VSAAIIRNLVEEEEERDEGVVLCLMVIVRLMEREAGEEGKEGKAVVTVDLIVAVSLVERKRTYRLGGAATFV